MFAALKEKLRARLRWFILGDYDKMKEDYNRLKEDCNRLGENVRNLNATLDGYDKVIENIRNSNVLIENLQTVTEMQKVKMAMLEKNAASQRPTGERVSQTEAGTGGGSDEGVYDGIDYFDFENYFRGSMEATRKNQMQYLKYFEGRTNVLDLGCGRGEFLKLLGENNIDAQGADFYAEFAEMCKMSGLKAVCDDAIHFLKTQEKVGGIFAGQLIEHLTTAQLVDLCNTAYQKLEEGASIVLETPNPTCLAIYTHAFYMDPSHQKPVHPLTLKYIMEKAGFSKIEILYTDTSRLPMSIPPLKGAENAEEFNEAMQTVSELLFGSQDYAVVGTK